MAIASNSLQAEDLLSAPADLPIPLSTLLGEPVFANPDPLSGLDLADPIAAQVSLASTDLFDAATAHDSSDFVVASTDQLTGLALSDSPDPLRLLDANPSPLLATAFASDGFLVYGESALQSFSIAEDQPFSLDLQALFPGANGIQGVTVVPLAAGDSSDWFQFGQRIPDATLAERLVIEGLFYDSQGNRLSSDAVAALAPGSLVQMDVVVTDTRAEGQGLLGLDLDLLWNPQALSLVDRQLVQTLPLFRNSGSIDAAAGSLTGLVAASLPSGGSGEVLGDTKRERFATLDYRVGEGATAGLNLALQPTKLPTRANQPLAAGQIVAVGTNTPTLPVLYGLADQPQVGVHRYQIQAFDSVGRHWQQLLSLTISNVNDAPVAVPLGPITAVEDQSFAFNVSTAFSDQDIAVGDVLTYRLLGQSPSWLGLNATTGLLQGAPGNAEVGSWQLAVEARDLSGATARQTLDLLVENVNDAPIWNAEPLPEIWLREGNPFEIRLSAGTITDVDQGDRLTYSLDLAQAPGLASLLVIDPVTGVINGLAPADQSEPFAFGLVATDQSGASTRVPLQLRVVDRDFNRAPYRVGLDLFDRTIQEGQSVALDLPSLFRDDDFLIGDRLNYQVDLPDWLQFDSTTGQVSGLAGNDAVGDHRISFRAVDTWGATAVASFWLSVDNVNQAPERLVPASEERNLLVNSPFSLNLNTVFRDLDAIHGDQLSFSLKARSSSALGIPNALRFDPRTGDFSFTPGASDRGQLSLLFTATDRSGASSSYQLDLGIVSPDGLVEVNRSLQDLVLREGTPSLLDLSTAFQQLRSSATLAYTVEALRLGKDGLLTSVQDPSWMSLFDRRQEDSNADRITITPTLRRLDTGELIRPENLAALPVGSTLGMDIKVNDLRQASSMPGVIGLDLDLNWSGLQLMNPASANLQQAITSLFPLYRQVDSSELADNHLRFSAASLPNLGLGEALGDSPEESFLRLDFRLIDPTQPVRLDLRLNGEDKGGLGIGLADGTSPGNNLKLKPFSSSALIDMLLRPGAEQVGNLVLRITAKATDPEAGLDSSQQDSVSQMFRVRVENTRNNAPTVANQIGATKLKDNRVQVIELRDLFRDSDDYAGDTPPLSYSLRVRGASLEQEQRLNQLVRIDTSSGQARLVITAPGLRDVLDGQVQIMASDGSLQASQSFALELTPSAQEVGIASSTSEPTITDGQPVSLGTIFGTAPLVFNDTADVTDLTIRSSQPIVVHLSSAFKALAGLNDAQATSLEAQWRLLPPSSSATGASQGVVVPISELASLLGPNQTSFDLAWIEVVPVATASGTLPIEISTSTRVLGDDGSRFGIQESARLQSTLIVPRQVIDSPSAPNTGFNPSPIGNGAGAPSARGMGALSGGGYSSGPLDRIGPAELAGPASTGVAAGPGAGGASEAGPASPPRAKSLLPSNRDGDGLEDDDSRRGQRRPLRPANPDDPNDLKGLLDNLIEAFNNPGSLAGLFLAMITMPGGGERGLRSLLLDSKLGQSIQVQRRNPELESEWNLRLRRPDGNSIPLILQLRRGQLTLLEDPNDNPPVGVGGLDGGGPLRNVLEMIPSPGELLADISRKLDRVLTSSDEEVDWIGWLTSVANQCRGPGAPGIRASLAELQQAVTLALSVDQSMADALMVTHLLHCHGQLGGELPWLKA